MSELPGATTTTVKGSSTRAGPGGVLSFVYLRFIDDKSGRVASIPLEPPGERDPATKAHSH